MEELRTELEQLEARASEYSVLKKPVKDQESALPEAERSEVEAELECPVCLGNFNNDLSFLTSKPLIQNCFNNQTLRLYSIYSSIYQ